MGRIRHTGPVGSILTTKMGHNGGPQWDPTGREMGFKYFDGSGPAATSGMVVSPDGTALFLLVTNSTIGSIFQYTLSVPHDFSSISGMSSVASISLGAAVSPGLDVNPSGTRFIYRVTSGHVRSVSCPTPWSLVGSTVDASAVATATSGFHRQFVTRDGSHLYQMSTTTIYKYAFTTPWDQSAGLTAAGTMTQTAFFTPMYPKLQYFGGSQWIAGCLSADGKRLFGYDLLGNINMSTLWSVDLSTPNDLFGTRAFRGKRGGVGPEISNTQITTMYLSADGKWLYWLTAWRATLTYAGSIGISP